MRLNSRWADQELFGRQDTHEIRFPAVSGLDQDEEWCEVRIGDRWEHFRFHDYDKIYNISGLYEALFYGELQCCSPQRVVNLFADVLEQDFADEVPDSLRVLDIGAGNGMVGERFREIGADTVIGIDIIPEAKDAAERDRPEVYDRYLVADLTDLPEQQEEVLRRTRLNCLTTVAALGFGDIPARAFLTGLELIDTPGWVAFNIKEDFIRDSDATGFSGLIQQLSSDEILSIEGYRRYQHRLSMRGEPLHYVAMVARKLRDLPDEYLEKD